MVQLCKNTLYLLIQIITNQRAKHDVFTINEIEVAIDGLLDFTVLPAVVTVVVVVVPGGRCIGFVGPKET